MNIRKLEKKYDVVVVGGGPGGLAAAIIAARNGSRVLLVEITSSLGGCAVSGLSVLGYLDRGGNKVLGGFAQELFDRLEQEGGAIGHFTCPVHNSISPVAPEVLKILTVQLCQEAGVEILFGCTVTDVQLHGNHIESISVFGKCTSIKIFADIFVDGTGDGDLAYLAGCEFKSGQDGTGINQPGTLMFSVSGYNLDRFFHYLEQHPEEVGIKEDYAKGYDVEFFRSTPGHCFIGLTNTVKRARAAGDFDIPRNQFIYIKSPHEDTLAVNTVRITDLDSTSPEEYSKAVSTSYNQIFILMKFMNKYMPGFENAVISTIAPTLGIRESRHFVGLKTLTSDSMFRYEVGSDTVALCGYNVDIHSGTATHIDLTPLEKSFGIPYGCLVARDVDNLFLAGRTLSVDSTVFAATRVMGPLIACGEAIGIAAHICSSESVKPADINIEQVRVEIVNNNGILDVLK